MSEPSNNFFEFNPRTWFISDLNPKREDEIIKWLGDSASNAWNIGITKIWFKNEADLILFKLTWN